MLFAAFFRILLIYIKKLLPLRADLCLTVFHTVAAKLQSAFYCYVTLC